MKKIIAFAPHTDDIELGCGGSISRFIDEGHEVYYIAFSICEEWVPKEYPSNILEIEAKKSAEFLGIKESNIKLYKFRATELWKVRDKIFDIMYEMNRSIKPNIVFAPSLNDLHQDHSLISQEAKRVFKNCTLLGYEAPWNNKEFKSNTFIKLEKKDIDKKIKAINIFESQKNKTYIDEEFIYALSKVRATQIQLKYAECFEVMNLVI